MKNKKSLFALLIFTLVLALGVGYAFSTTNLVINGSATVAPDDSNFFVYLTNPNNKNNDKLSFTLGEQVDGAENASLTANFAVEEGALVAVGDTISGEISIKNGSAEGIMAQIKSINEQAVAADSSITMSDSDITYYAFDSEGNKKTTALTNGVGFYSVTISPKTGNDDVFASGDSVTYVVTVRLEVAPTDKIVGEFSINFEVGADSNVA